MDTQTVPMGFPHQIETRSMDLLTEFVDQLAAEAEATAASTLPLRSCNIDSPIIFC